MGKHLDLDDVAATSELAAQELADLRSENNRLREEVMHLRIYAPGQHQAHVVKTIPRIGPTNWRFWGLEESEKDFDTFGKLVPNESEA